jgi:prepilin-type N-terminal cleavage/methylation domain-containing protein
MRGFSLIEVVIVIAIVAFVASIGTVFSMGSISRSYALSERDLLVALLTQTRAKALANVHESAHSVHIATSTYVLYEGTTFASNNPTNRHVPRVSRTTLSGIGTVSFSPLYANTATSGVITVVGDTQTYEVEINSVGMINW